MSIGPNEKKLIEKLQKDRKVEIRKANDWYKKQVDEISRGDKEIKQRFYLESKNEEPTDIKYYALVNVQALKEFIKYGSNKVLDQIRIRSHANTLAREEIDKLKKKGQGTDSKTMIMTIAIVAIIGVMVYVVATGLLNYDSLNQKLIEQNRATGTCQGQLANCMVQLDFFKPGTIAKPLNTTGGSAPPNSGGVLQG